MIGRLRRKFIVINMSLLMVMLLVIFGLVYHFTARNLEDATMSALRSAANSQMRPGRPGDLTPDAAIACFTIEENPRGDLVAMGSQSFDLTDESMLLEIYRLAQSGGQTGVLEEYALRYCRTDGFLGNKYAFADISAQRQTLQNLVRILAAVGVFAAAAFFGISFLLARWAVGPVERAWQQQRQFVADASHELKTPLTVILTNAELLRSEEYDADRKRSFADNIHTMSCQMRALVERLLELARGDNGQMPKQEKLDLSRLLEEAVLPFEPLFFEKGLTLETEVETGVCVSGDIRSLRQVVDILLDNALKYADTGSTATLTFSRSGRGKCLISVTSEGQTLTPQQCKDIFKRFYRADPARSRDGSFGLGLSIAEQIVSLHGGRIWAQGKEGKNTFFVSLPER